MTPRKRSKTASVDIRSRKPPESSVWTIEILDRALDQIRAFDTAAQRRVFKFLDRLLRYPTPRTIGESLTGELDGYWRYRIGDYRLVCEIADRRMAVVVAKAAHRREVYR
jgi:mRNA interferase RelE/StbE